MEIRASFHAATLNLVTNVAKSVEDSIMSGGVEVVIDEVKVCYYQKNACVQFAFSGELNFMSVRMFAWPHYSTQHLSLFNFLFLCFCLYLYFFPQFVTCSKMFES